MKFPFHITLLTLLLSLLMLTGAAIALTSYLNTRQTVEDLSEQILGHATIRIDHQINDLLIAALKLCKVHLDLMESPRFSAKDHAGLAANWRAILKQHPWFREIGFTWQDTGEASYAARNAEGALIAIDLPKRNANSLDDDPRQRPPYLKVQAAGKQVWTETYMLPAVGGLHRSDIPGLSCAVPIHRPDGTLLGVFSVTFDLRNLCDYLRDISVADDGFPFIVEIKDKGHWSVIAHPDLALLLRQGKTHTELIDADLIGDSRVRDFLAAVKERHPDLVPTELKKKSEAELRKLAQIRFTHDGIPYRGTYRCLTTDVTPDWLICIVVPESSILGHVERNTWHMMYVLGLIAIAATLLSLLVALQVSRPLQRLAKETEAIGRLELTAQPVKHSLVDEVDRLVVAMESMKTSLRSFQIYVPADVVRALLSAGQDAVLGGERRIVTICFTDIADFTSIAERLSPEQLVSQLADYFSAMSEVVLSTGGTVDKYIGDSVMAFWGAPQALPRHALAACTAALQCQARLRAINEQWQADNKPVFLTRIGLCTGDVIVGNFGSAARLNYTVIGDSVNLASRLEGLNKYYGTRILISDATFREAQTGIIVRPLDWVSVKGKSTGVLVHELLGLKGQSSAGQNELAELYRLALMSYREQQWATALERFGQVLRIQPDDLPAQQMIERCRTYQQTPPGPAWDGVHRMATK